MAKNQVTLTFAGDSKSLDKTFDNVGSGAKSLEADLGKVGAGTRTLEADLGRLGGRSQATGRAMDDGAARASRYGSGIEGVGERADEVDTRMMGLSDGITGASELMRSGELSAAEMAMAVADLGSFIYNSAAPSVADLRDKLRGVPDAADRASDGLNTTGGAADSASGRMGKLGKAAAIAGGALGLGALAFGLYQAGEASKELQVDTDELARSLAQTDGVQRMGERLAYMTGFGLDASEAMDKILEQSPELAGGFLEAAEAAGIEGDELAAMREQVREAEAATNAVEDAQSRYNDELTNGAQSARDYSDALNAAFDPVFAMYDALGQNREAQAAVTEAQTALNEAIRDHGRSSDEAAAADQALRDAQMANAESALGVTSAQNELIASIRSGETSVTNLRAQMQLWDQQGLLSQGVLQAVAGELGVTTNEALRLGGIDPNVDITAVDMATSPIQSIAANLGWLDGQEATVTIREVRQTFFDTIRRDFGWGAATGGIVPQYLAGGGIGGPRGTDTVPAWLTPGEMVLNDAQQAELFAMANGRGGGGGGAVVINVAGSIRSDRDLVQLVRQELSRGGFRGVR